jgi:hypothetical protein
MANMHISLFFLWIIISQAAFCVNLVTNAGFETGNLEGWKHWSTKYAAITQEAYAGQYAVKIGPERAFCRQETKVRPYSLYRISAYI